MNPYQTYRSRQSTNWTRIDMLLKIYRETELSLRTSLYALSAEDQEAFLSSQMRTIKLLLLLTEGIEPDRDPIAENVMRLCVYMFGEVSKQTIEGHRNALAILTRLREGFERIHGEAEALEAEGAIPGLTNVTEVSLAVS